MVMLVLNFLSLVVCSKGMSLTLLYLSSYFLLQRIKSGRDGSGGSRSKREGSAGSGEWPLCARALGLTGF